MSARRSRQPVPVTPQSGVGSRCIAARALVRAVTATKHELGLSPSYRVVSYSPAMEAWAIPIETPGEDQKAGLWAPSLDWAALPSICFHFFLHFCFLLVFIFPFLFNIENLCAFFHFFNNFRLFIFFISPEKVFISECLCFFNVPIFFFMFVQFLFFSLPFFPVFFFVFPFFSSFQMFTSSLSTFVT